ncbi:MAG TPA: hypothetical protein DEO73_17260 [Pantoea sp.]|nr:hypothetical protein [Pantoea sp.]
MIDRNDISVVVQGPIVHAQYKDEKVSWTHKCIQQLVRLLPDAQIILSTWEGEDLNGLPEVSKIITTQKIEAIYYDEHLGIYDNTNRQILSTLSGLSEADGKYALKIRTDTILESDNFLNYFDRFKERDKNYSVFGSRIVASSVYAKKYAGSGDFVTKQLFQPSDIILFGLKVDLHKLYDVPLNTKEDSHFFRNFDKPCLDVYTHMLSRYTPEQHIFISCLRNNGKEVYWPHRLYITKKLEEESEKYICDNYTFVDQSNFSFEIKGHLPQRELDAFVWNGLYRESVWIADYNRIYKKAERAMPSAEEKYRASLFTKFSIKQKTKSAIKYSIIMFRMGTKLKLARKPYAMLNRSVTFRDAKERIKRKMVKIPSIGKINDANNQDKKVITNISQVGDEFINFETISFDIFDTLLRRHVEPVYVPLAQTGLYAEFLLKRECLDITSDIFNRVRQEAVNEFYDNNRRAGFDHEYAIFPVIQRTLLKIGLDANKAGELAKTIVKNELEREIKTLYVADNVRPLLQKIKEAGKRLIAISDMYFSAENIKHILKEKDLLHYFDDVYVSSEYMLTKHSGRLFDEIKKFIDTDKMLHIGDNLNSDGIAPRRRGIRSLWLNDNKDLFRRLKSHDAASTHSVLRRLIANDIKKNNIYKDDISRCIYENISYDFMAFAHNILQYAHLNSIDRLYFLERDGSIFCDIIKELSKKIIIFNGLKMPEMEKVRMPRRVSAPLGDLSDPEKVIRRAYKVGIPETFSLSFVLGAYGISSETIHERFPNEKDASIDIKDFIDNYDAFYKTLLVERRQEVVSALAPYKFFEDGNIAVIDIGWGGTSQKDIGSYIIENGLKVECHGIYYGVDGRIGDLANYYPSANKYFGYHDASTFFGSYSLLEFLIKNYGIDKDPKDVSSETLLLNKASRDVLFSCVDQYADLVNTHCLTASNVSSVTARMASSFVNRPPSKFVKAIKGASFSLDRKEDDEFVPLVEKVKLNTGLLKSIRRLDKNAQWVWGSLVYSKLAFIVKLIK